MSNFICIEQSEYPELLRHIHQAPKKLYYKGNLEVLNGVCLAFVGTRKASEYGESVVARIIEELSLCGVVIVSGLANGIDTFAHKAALSVGLKTVAVLGTGTDNIYPEKNLELAREIVAKGGAIISEYEDGAEALEFHFPARNRIIAGLSLATIVIEAPEKSGALITAKRANEENREVFAVPGDIDRPMSVGCNKLIQDLAAKPLLFGGDIIRELGIQAELFVRDENSGNNSSEMFTKGKYCEKDDNCALLTLNHIPKTRPISKEQLISKTGLPIEELNKNLSFLEISGLIMSTNSGFYIRK